VLGPIQTRREADPESLRLFFAHPVFQPEARHLFEFFCIVSDQNQALRAGMTGNHLVIRPNRFAALGQFSPNLSGVYRGIVIVGNYLGKITGQSKN